MSNLRGTPKSLTQAIVNGLDDYEASNKTTKSQCIEFIRVNVSDFMRNKLGPVMMSSDIKDMEKQIKRMLETFR